MDLSGKKGKNKTIQKSEKERKKARKEMNDMIMKKTKTIDTHTKIYLTDFS